MDQLILSDKATTETISLTAFFADRLQYGETINGSSVTAVVSSGIDPTPSAILSGASTYTATTVTQAITGGVAGVTYTLIFLATGTNSHNYVKQGYLSIVAPGTF
jgi:hypothetical protein